MGSQLYKLVALAAFVWLWLAPLQLSAQGIDSAFDAWSSMRTALGHSAMGLNETFDTTSIDSGGTNAAVESLSEGIRRVAMEMPFYVDTTITIVEGTFIYTLGTNFMMNSEENDGPERAMQLLRVGSTSINPIPHKALNELGGDTKVSRTISGWNLQGRKLIVDGDKPAGETIYVWGMGIPSAITGGGSLMTAMPENQRQLAIWYALLYFLGDTRPMLSGSIQQRIDSAKTAVQPR